MATDRTLGPASPNNAITTETVSGEIQAGPLNTNFGNLEIAVETHLHGLNAQVGWDSMKSNFRPPDTGDSSNRWRMVCGKETIVIAGGQNSKAATITFASDADQGDPSFSAAPRVVATIYGASVGYAIVTDIASSSTATITIYELNGGTTGGTVQVHWMAYGKVA